jgi:hypothetical protein
MVQQARLARKSRLIHIPLSQPKILGHRIKAAAVADLLGP